MLSGLIKTQSNNLIYGNVDVLVFALRIFCPMWNHQVGSNNAQFYGMPVI